MIMCPFVQNTVHVRPHYQFQAVVNSPFYVMWYILNETTTNISSVRCEQYELVFKTNPAMIRVNKTIDTFITRLAKTRYVPHIIFLSLSDLSITVIYKEEVFSWSPLQCCVPIRQKEHEKTQLIKHNGNNKWYKSTTHAFATPVTFSNTID